MKKLGLAASILLMANSIFAQPGPGGMFGYGEPSTCKPAAKYYFKGEMDMKMTMTKKAKDSTHINSVSYFNNSNHTLASVMTMPMGENTGLMTTIMNFEDSTMVSLMDFGEMKTASCRSMKGFGNEKRQFQGKRGMNRGNYDFSNFKATGNTKKICGYECKEYLMERGDTVINLFISDEASGLGLAREGLSGKSGINFKDGKSGMTMEMTRTNKKSKEYFQMLVTKIDLNFEGVISTDGFTLR